MVVVKHNSTGNILGSSTELTQLRGLIKQCAASDAPVLLRGESGTGKELVSRALHASLLEPLILLLPLIAVRFLISC